MNTIFLNFLKTKGYTEDMDMNSFVKKNLDISFFSHNNDIDMTMMEVFNEFSQIDLKEEVLSLFSSLSEQDKTFLLSNITIQELIFIALDIIKFPPRNLESFYKITYISNQFISMRLFDENYSFPEAKIFFLYQEIGFNIVDIINYLEEEIYDYSTHSVGETNHDKREEYLCYFHKFLIPFLQTGLSFAEQKEAHEKEERIKELKESIEKFTYLSNMLSVLKLAQSLNKDKELSSFIEKEIKDIDFQLLGFSSLEKMEEELNFLKG